MDEDLLKALNSMCDDLGAARLEDALEEPEKYTYIPNQGSTDETQTDP